MNNPRGDPPACMRLAYELAAILPIKSHDNIDDIANIICESIIAGFHNGINYIAYCCNDEEKKASICMIYHVIYTNKYIDIVYNKKAILIQLFKEYEINRDIENILKVADAIVYQEKYVYIYIKDSINTGKIFIRKFVNNKKITCSNIKYLFVDPYALPIDLF